MIRFILMFLLIFISSASAGIDLESGSSEILHHADGNETDISGADAQLSIMAWIKPESTTGSHYVINKFRASGTKRSYSLIIFDNSDAERIVCFLSDDGSSNSSTNSDDNTISDGVWVHVGCVYDDVDLSAFIDGVQSGTPTAHTAGINNSSVQFILGAQGEVGAFLNQYFDGIIDDVCVYNTALSDNEMSIIGKSRIKGMCKQISPDNLVFYASFDKLSDGTSLSGDYTVDIGTDVNEDNTPVQRAVQYLSYP